MRNIRSVPSGMRTFRHFGLAGTAFAANTEANAKHKNKRFLFIV